MKPEKLLLIPGPSPVHPRIINSLSSPTISHVSPLFVEELKEALVSVKKIVFCERGEAFIIAGAGTLVMEMALLNTVEKGEKLLVLSQGYFGSRMVQIAHSFGLECNVLESPWGKAVLPEKLEEELTQRAYAAVAVTHVDTATGACAPVKDYANVLKRFESLLLIDGVCATGGIEERMDEWGVDVIMTAAQKCFGAPPGLAILVVSEKGMEKRRSMKSISAYYSDLLNWLPVMKDPSKYFSTPCVNEIRGFTESTRIILEEGIENRFRRHSLMAQAIRAALHRLGFSLFTEEPFLADTLSVVRYPAGIQDEPFRSALYREGVVVAGGLGETLGQVFRMGHMGNLSLSQLFFAIQALEKALASRGHDVEPGTGVRAAQEIIGEEIKKGTERNEE